MSYAIIRNANYKKDNLAGLYKHNERKNTNSKENKHIPIETLKSITNYENIKFEMEQEYIQPLETKNTALIVQQNKELIQYTKKLKQQLSKSHVAIQRNEQLQKENIESKQENYQLHQENSKLMNYIDKTFQAVKTLFDFPIATFKRLVDNLIKTINEK